MTPIHSSCVPGVSRPARAARAALTTLIALCALSAAPPARELPAAAAPPQPALRVAGYDWSMHERSSPDVACPRALAAVSASTWEQAA